MSINLLPKKFLYFCPCPSKLSLDSLLAKELRESQLGDKGETREVTLYLA